MSGMRNLFYTFRMNYKHGLYYLRKLGFKKTYAKVRSTVFNDLANYQQWINENENKNEEIKELKFTPKISVVVPVYNVLDKHLIPCIESVINQTYSNWELCLADDNSTFENVRVTLDKYKDDDRIKVVYREKNGHISKCTNSAIELATGEYIALLDCDDVITPDALYEVAKCLNKNPDLDFIYSDEDKVDTNGGNRRCPHFKPDWSPDTLMSNMYTCHLGVYRTSRVRDLGGLREGYEGSQDYDFTLRFTEGLPRDHIAHISKILYHWRERAESTAVNPESKPYILEAARKAKEDALKRRNLKADFELIEELYQWRVRYIPQGNPLVSVISDDAVAVRKVLEGASYKNVEIVASHSEANGEYLLFLNSGLKPDKADFIEVLLGHAQVNYTGAVGAKILTRDERIISCGFIGDGKEVRPAFKNKKDMYIYYFGHNKQEFNYLAVSGLCLMVNRVKFIEAGSLTDNLDLCISLYDKGYYNVVRTDVVMKAFGDIKENSKELLRKDSFYNINFIGSADYSLFG